MKHSLGGISLVKWDDVYQDEIDEDIIIKKYEDKKDLKKVCTKWNNRFLKNSRYPALIGFFISLLIIFLLHQNNVITESFEIFSFTGFIADFIVFGIFFLIFFGLISALIQWLYLFTKKKGKVEYKGKYNLKDEK